MNCAGPSHWVLPVPSPAGSSLGFPPVRALAALSEVKCDHPDDLCEGEGWIHPQHPSYQRLIFSGPTRHDPTPDATAPRPAKRLSLEYPMKVPLVVAAGKRGQTQ
ncbi:MAG: hypothetical protein ABSH20_27725 [Tepidisphaeraceae bacterium]